MRQISTFSLIGFAREHDNLPSFHAAFLVLTFIAAALFNLGFFGMLIAFHMLLDIVKYRQVHKLNWKKTAEGVIRESIVDVALFFMGLVFSMYLHPTLTGLNSIRGLMLAELTIFRAMGVMTPKLKILYDFMKILSHLDLYMERLSPHLGKKISVLEYACMVSIGVTLALIITAPMMLHVPASEFIEMLLEECIPWRI